MVRKKQKMIPERRRAKHTPTTSRDGSESAASEEPPGDLANLIEVLSVTIETSQKTTRSNRTRNHRSEQPHDNDGIKLLGAQQHENAKSVDVSLETPCRINTISSKVVCWPIKASSVLVQVIAVYRSEEGQVSACEQPFFGLDTGRGSRVV
ncbi:hypothetical protein TNCV_767971 [Trichonephila clavipes]|nr:hypothetical protein TNCV_767971 [Trichonephila clavipes]